MLLMDKRTVSERNVRDLDFFIGGGCHGACILSVLEILPANIFPPSML